MIEERIVAPTLADTRALAGRLAIAVRDHLRTAGAGASVLIGLDGQLGAGKTAFVQGFVAALDPKSERHVTSPTFAIAQVYETDPPVTHMDLYRLGSLEDLEAIGYRDLYFAPGATLVEWISRVPEALPVSPAVQAERAASAASGDGRTGFAGPSPVDWIEIHLAVLVSDVREIRVRAHGSRFAELVRKMAP